jgi:hypothetical protein
MECLTLVLLTLVVPTQSPDGSPSEVFRAFLAAANRGAYVTAEGYLTAEAAQAIRKGLGGEGALREYCDMRTRNRSLVRIRVLGEDIRGESASVRFEIDYRGEGLATGEECLVRDGSRWRIGLACPPPFRQ